MKKTKITVMILFACIVVAAIAKDMVFDTSANAKKRLVLSLEGRDGGTNFLAYRMYFLSLIPMGTLELRLPSLDTPAIISLEASPKGGIMQNRVDASARLESHLSQGRDLSDRYVERTKYKEKIENKTIDFDRKNLIAIRGDRKIKIPADTYDPVSAFYTILRQKLAKGDKYSVRCLSEDVIYLLTADVEDDAEGLFKIRMEIKREDGTSGHGAQFRVWVARGAGEAFLPILFKSWTPVGYASVILQKTQ